MGLLSGIKVLESAQLFNGDTLGALLGDLGADVVKIESPFRGDYLRDFLGQVTPHNSPAHLQVNKTSAASRWTCETNKAETCFGGCWRVLTSSSTATPQTR